MKPASRKPMISSFHSIDQSMRKLPATSLHAFALRRRPRSDSGSLASSALAGRVLVAVMLVAALLARLGVCSRPRLQAL